MKICVYVLTENAKKTYANESYDVRLNAGMMVIVDVLQRNGYEVEYASNATVHNYDVVLMSITSDCDWWPFIAERDGWQKGNYKVIVGGQGVLNVRPFLRWVDYFVLGRAEGAIVDLINALGRHGDYEGPQVVNSKTFSVENNYFIGQTKSIYPYDIKLENKEIYHEDAIGCNHKCLFCGYTWHRKQVSQEEFNYSGLWNGGKDRERAIIDMAKGVEVDLVKLRTTAIDGLSERLRVSVNKKITRQMLRDFICRIATCEKPHQVKFYNIIGYPGETEDDWWEFLEDIQMVDKKLPKTEKQTCILLHSTPFRAMPATPLACRPMSYKNYRKAIASTVGRGLKGNIFYQGGAIWAVESMGTESLPTVIQSAIALRGVESDSDNFLKLAKSKKFDKANMQVKTATLEKYFDVKSLFGAFKSDTLPTRYLKTYAKVEKFWR